MTHLRLTRQQIETMVGLSYESAPREACGLLTGQDEQVQCVLVAENIAADRGRYEINPEQLGGMLASMKQDGRDLLGIWHSHPGADARPSSTDSSQAFYPQTVYVIISVPREGNPRNFGPVLSGLGIDYAGDPGPAVLRGHLCTEAGGGWREVPLLT